MKIMRSISRLTMTSAAALLTAGVAYAADAPATELDQVVVTATRREENLQVAPVSVSAITAKAIERSPALNIGDLASIVPNFHSATAGALNSASFGIRGVAQNESNIYTDQPVGVIVDDFVMPNTLSQLLDTFDLQQVEVLRGPQGTLYGKNTTAGLVNATTKRPVMNDFSAEMRLNAGSFDTREIRAAVNLPIIHDMLAARIVAYSITNEGYYHNGGCWFGLPNLPANLATGCGNREPLGGRDISGGRAKLLFTPNDKLTLYFQYENIRDRSDIPVVVNETPHDATFLLSRLGYYRTPTSDPLDSVSVFKRSSAFVDSAGGQKIDQVGYYFTGSYELPLGKIVAVLGKQRVHDYMGNSWGGPISINDVFREDDSTTRQEELRFVSSWDAPVQLVVGAFHQSRDIDFCQVRLQGLSDLLGAVSPTGERFADSPRVICNKQDSTATSAYADGTWKVTDKLTIGAGYRWTKEEKEFAARPLMFVQQLAGGFNTAFTWRELGSLMAAGDFNRFNTLVFKDKRTWKEPNWRFNASYQFTPDVMAYGTVAHGFRSGAYNESSGTGGTLTARLIQPTNPELATSYEIGFKSEFLDNRARLNVTAYHVKYDDMQRSLNASLVAGGANVTQIVYFNAATAKVQGIEVEALFRPTAELELFANLGTMDGKYGSFKVDTNFDGVIDVDFTKRKMNNAPPLSWSVGATYTLDLSDYGTVRFFGDVVHHDKTISTYSDLRPSLDGYLEANTLLNGSITWTHESGKVFVQLIGRNLTDERFHTINIPAGTTGFLGTYAEPRFVGVGLGLKY